MKKKTNVTRTYLGTYMYTYPATQKIERHLFFGKIRLQKGNKNKKQSSPLCFM